MTGYIRLISFRSDKEIGPEPDEILIDFDRSHLILGNRHYLKDKRNMSERLICISNFSKDLDADENVMGPMTMEIISLARRIINGEKIVGRCWCYPLPCHVNEIINRINIWIARFKK